MKDDRGKLDLTKQIEVLKAEVELLSSHLGEAYVKIKNLNERVEWPDPVEIINQ